MFRAAIQIGRIARLSLRQHSFLVVASNDEAGGSVKRVSRRCLFVS